MEILSKIQDLAKAWQPTAVKLRRHLHQHPELSFEEHETAAFVSTQLTQMGIPHQTGIAGTGIVGWIEGDIKGSDKIVALRADMDALPILEKNEVSYASTNKGVMHACGHDVHTTSLLGAAHILLQLKPYFSGKIQLIFQPGEEKLPGGASLMLKEGILDLKNTACIIGQHVHPPMHAGEVGFKSGMYMASADEIYVTVTGKGGHGALPHQCIDTVLITSHLIVALQQIVSRIGDPTIPSVLTFGKINSTGGSTNVIPNEVKLQGTFRTMDETWRAEAHKKMKHLAHHLVTSMGGTVDFRIDVGYPYLQNDETWTPILQAAAAEYNGEERVHTLPIRMTAEDFSYFTQVAPACFYRLGTGNIKKGITSNIHTDTFDIDEDALATGAGMMAWLAFKVVF